MSGYAIHPEALLELEEISKYHEQFSESFVAKLRKELYTAFDWVVQFRRHGFLRPDLANSSVRFKLVRDYLHTREQFGFDSCCI